MSTPTAADLVSCLTPADASLAEARFAGVLDAVPGGLILLDAKGTILEVNSRLAQLTGRTRQDLIGHPARRLVREEDLQRSERAMWRLWEVPGTTATMHANLHGPDGTPIPVRVTGASVAAVDRDADVVLYVEDQRERMQTEARVDYLSRIDPVTGQLNRRTITNWIGTALRAVEDGRQVAVLAVDLDRFQTVNDRLGHTFGDHVLSTVGARMVEVCDNDAVGRLGADEFVVVVESVTSVDDLRAKAAAVRDAISGPISAGDEVVHLTATVGIASESDPDAHAESLVQRADIALHRARTAGRTIDVADEHDARAVVAQLEMEAAVSSAIHDDGLYVAFQPIFDAEDRPMGVEALVRAHDDTISAADIVAAAERSSLIRDLGRVVLDKALAAMPQLTEAAGRPLQLSVNLSARQLHEPTMVGQLLEAARRHRFPADRLCVEVTETSAMADPSATIETLSSLRDAGIEIAIDDFGSGYSSFSYLRDLPVDRVKVDQTFLRRAGEDPAARQVLEGMIGLCSGLGLHTVCEGVENDHQRDVAVHAGTDGWQGYLGCRPLPADQLAEILISHGAATESEPADELSALLSQLRMVDLLVFRKVAGGRYAHLGGVGQGDGWAGVVEVDLAAESFVATALERSDRVFISSSEPVRVVGPYYATTSVVVATDDALVVIGHPDQALAVDRDDPRVDRLVAAAVAQIAEVSPAKPLADELEVLEAVQQLLRFDGDDRVEALRHLLAVTCEVLGCDVGIACLEGIGTVTHGVDGVDDLADGGVGVDLCDVLDPEPRCMQYADDDDLPGGLVARLGIRSWYAVPLREGAGRMLIAHSDASPRGFTGLCQRVGRTLADSSDVLFRSAEAREELTRQVDRASSEARTDALTGLANRLAWDEAVDRLAGGVRGVGVMVMDLDRFKALNDSRGHAEGDQTLRDIAEVLAEEVPAAAVAARTGGDEFGVVLETDDPAAVETLKSRIMDRLTSEVHGTTCTVGTAWTEGGAGLEAALITADRAMYDAKPV